TNAIYPNSIEGPYDITEINTSTCQGATIRRWIRLVAEFERVKIARRERTESTSCSTPSSRTCGSKIIAID
ncbi:hypothetical protein, partial [Staphylococcus aureus]